MQQSDTISLMVDESTDVLITKQLVLYGRCVMNGMLNCNLLGIRDLFNSTADAIERYGRRYRNLCPSVSPGCESCRREIT